MLKEYLAMLKRLELMNKKELIELFHDMENIESIKRISEAASSFLENYVHPDDDQCEHEWVDWKRQDDAQRYRDIKSTMDYFE